MFNVQWYTQTEVELLGKSCWRFFLERAKCFSSSWFSNSSVSWAFETDTLQIVYSEKNKQIIVGENRFLIEDLISGHTIHFAIRYVISCSRSSKDEFWSAALRPKDLWKLSIIKTVLVHKITHPPTDRFTGHSLVFLLFWITSSLRLVSHFTLDHSLRFSYHFEQHVIPCIAPDNQITKTTHLS